MAEVMIIQLKTVLKRTIEFLKSPRGESVRYVFIGGCTTLLDYIVYHVMIACFDISVTVSNIVSAAVAILFAYVANKRFVFFSRTSGFSELAVEFLKFLVSRLFTFILEIAGVHLFVTILGQSYWLGKAETIVVVVIVNYLLSKLVVFRQNKTQR